MDRRQRFLAKESELDRATNEMERAVAAVKNLSSSVKSGTADKRELEIAIADLKKKSRKVEILSAESKMLGGFSAAKEIAPVESNKMNKLWLLAVLGSAFVLLAP